MTTTALAIFLFLCVGPTHATTIDGLKFGLATDKKQYFIDEAITLIFTWESVSKAPFLIEEDSGAGCPGVLNLEGLKSLQIIDPGGAEVRYIGPCGVRSGRSYIKLNPGEKRVSTSSISGISNDPDPRIRELHETISGYRLRTPGRYVLKAAYLSQPGNGADVRYWKGVIKAPEVKIKLKERAPNHAQERPAANVE